MPTEREDETKDPFWLDALFSVAADVVVWIVRGIGRAVWSLIAGTAAGWES